MHEQILTPTDFVAIFNQTIEFAYPQITIEGELSSFRISKNRWVYFDLKDNYSKVSFFGAVTQLPGPLTDGMLVRVIGFPKLHNQYGFSINFTSLLPAGEGSIKKAAELLERKLRTEGLFDEERKRSLPVIPHTIGLITSDGSAAAADFYKILNERWVGVQTILADVYVQGEKAPLQIVAAIEQLNQLPRLPEVVVIIRGGGSAEDLSAFNDERVVRSVAGSRIPTLIAIGHEVDFSLAEMAADKRASTPSNAASIVVPDKLHIKNVLESSRQSLFGRLKEINQIARSQLAADDLHIRRSVLEIFERHRHNLMFKRQFLKLLDPKAALKRGYAIISKDKALIKSVRQLRPKDIISIELSDGSVSANISGSN